MTILVVVFKLLHVDIHTYRQTDRQTDRQMNKQVGRLRYMQLIGTYLEIVILDVPQTMRVACIPVFSAGLISNCNPSLW